MKIYLDNIIFALQKAGGISVYWSELIQRMKAEDCVMYEPENTNIFRKDLAIITKVEARLPNGLLRYLPFLKKIPKEAIFHSSYYRFSPMRSVINVTTVHDFTYEYFSSGIKKTVHSIQKYLAIKYADGIICVSENTKNDLLKFYPQFSSKEIRVIPNGVNEKFFPMSDFSEDVSPSQRLPEQPFLLFVGERKGYKNFQYVVDLLKELETFHLVVVGGGDFNLHEKESLEPFNHRIHHYQGIAVEALNRLYNQAFAFIYPSSYEGFGIPVIEAMKAGCPVIAYQASSIPEIAGDACLLVNHINVAALKDKIELLQNSHFRDQLIQKGLSRADAYSWDKCHQQTIEFYQFLYNKKVKFPT